MKQIARKYEKLKPSIAYLADEPVMAQAWKKTHGYIRKFNWYADVLALDISALTIEDNAKKWAKDVLDASTWEPELIPACKSEKWEFKSSGWKPSKRSQARDASPPLRPLAHLAIRDQTWATAAMLCLADAVETLQGNCDPKDDEFEISRREKVFSYGNRLVCDWNEDKKAWFRWGNGETYRKFFTDYQNFLKRPLKVGRTVSDKGEGGEDVYVVNLDLSKFYNNIDTSILIERLKLITKEFGHENCNDFWDALSKILTWKWSKSDKEKARQLKLGDIEKGLPQGLVSAGFFANAYLLEFDRQVGRALDDEIEENLTIHDYCRYVDDLRLVVSTERLTSEEVRNCIHKFVGGLLSQFGGSELKLNQAKTKVLALHDLDNKGSTTGLISIVQGELSGPADRDVLDSAANILESFLSYESEPPPDLSISHADRKLIQISSFDHDIREDTLKRFSANRLEKIVRNKRRLICRDESDESVENSSSELLAKKMITAWMKDPSLTLLLRKAMEIYPDGELFEPVLDAIFTRSSFYLGNKEGTVTNSMMDFVLADLFRSGYEFKRLFQLNEYPEDLLPDSIIDLLARYAQLVLKSGRQEKLVSRQALLLLAVDNKPVQLGSSKDSIQHSLHAILLGNLPDPNLQRSALFEVAAQITDRFDRFASLFLESSSGNIDDLDQAIMPFAKRGGPFWSAVWRRLGKDANFKGIKDKYRWAAPIQTRQPKQGDQRLSGVIGSDQNGFVFEHSLIKLALGLVNLVKKDAGVIGRSPKQIKVSIKSGINWSDIWSDKVDKIICAKTPMNFIDPRFETPSWIERGPDGDFQIIYWIATILRASAIGGSDFTGNRWRVSKSKTYKGVRTSWYKRRMGMMHSPEALVGEDATISDWFSSLLARCLQWPGFEASHVEHKDILDIDNLMSFERCLKERLDLLNSDICIGSNLPVLRTAIRQFPKDRDFNIVTVQQLMPKQKDFTPSDVALNNSNYRCRHRDHLSKVCQLVLKTLVAKSSCENSEVNNSVNLIVFPELSIHLDDQDLIKTLAEKAKAIVFAGIVFSDKGGKLVNFARWFIPHYRDSGRQWLYRDQGKQHLIPTEKQLGIQSYRPVQHLIEIHGHSEGPFVLSGSICFDATDISLAADLRNKTDLFVIAAHNKDVNTFDNMVAALHYHMYQHVVIANLGEFGGSTIQAPYKEPYERLISHVHGIGQIAISTASIDLAAFRRNSKQYRQIKGKPAGIA